jgi:hypothetical protein
MSRVLKQITELERLPHAELKERWRELYGTEPPSSGRAYLLRRLQYRVQELAYGGVSEATRAHLRRHLESIGEDGEPGAATRLARRQRKNGMPIVGTVFVREWHDVRHVVTVVPGGVEYQGRRYRSLSAIAREITGTRWNGPLFFGLRRQANGKEA